MTQPPDRNKKALYTSKSVLARFREYAGPRTPQALALLFDQEPLIGFRQAPPLFLSDGRNTVSVTFIAMPAGGNKPDITIKSAELVSLEKDPENTNTWIAKVKPGRGAYEATLVVPQDRVTMEFPLTIAPRANIDLEKKGSATEADFTAFLKEQGTQKNPRFDLNGDGRHDYVDDYIYTANFLAAQKAPSTSAAKK